MQPSEFFALHPQEFWWLVEAWGEQDRKRKGAGGLSQNDRDDLKALAARAKKLHEQGKWDARKGFAK